MKYESNAVKALSLFKNMREENVVQRYYYQRDVYRYWNYCIQSMISFYEFHERERFSSDESCSFLSLSRELKMLESVSFQQLDKIDNSSHLRETVHRLCDEYDPEDIVVALCLITLKSFMELLVILYPTLFSYHTLRSTAQCQKRGNVK